MKDINWNEPVIRFREHFGYSCQYPPNANIFSEKDFNDFSDLISKCIHDDFDYTIKECGTQPPAYKGLPQILVD